MAVKNLMETKIPQMYSAALYNEKEYDLGAEHTDKVLDVIVNGVSACLADIKNKDYPVAFVFEENNLDFIAGAVVEYHPNEDEKLPGNWSYIWTFEKSDIPEKARVVKISDSELGSYFRGVGATKFGLGFTTQESLIEVTRYLLKIIRNYLDSNAVDGEVNGIILDGVIQARVGVENGEVVKSIEPIGETKVLIKGDADIEV